VDGQNEVNFELSQFFLTSSKSFGQRDIGCLSCEKPQNSLATKNDSNKVVFSWRVKLAPSGLSNTHEMDWCINAEYNVLQLEITCSWLT
jgi:hypothetical protein